MILAVLPRRLAAGRRKYHGVGYNFSVSEVFPDYIKASSFD